MGLDPISIGASALQSVIGGVQAAIGAHKAKKAQRELENLQTPRYNESKSIMDYYNNALQRYNLNPYQSAQYNYARQAADRSQAAGINALQGRGSAVGGIARLSAINNDALQRAGVQAEQEQNQRFGQLGQAAQMKTAEGDKAFQYNEIAPYEKKYNLLSMKAGAANQTVNSGLQNVFGGLGALQDYSNINRMYGGGGYGSNGKSSTDNGVYSPSYYDYMRNKSTYKSWI